VSWSWASYFVSLVYPWKNTIIYFWFLPTLFLVFLLAPGLRAILLWRRWPVLVALTVVFLLLNLTQVTAFHDMLNYRGVLRGLLLFWLGMLVCEFRLRLRWLEQGWMIPVALTVLLATYFFAKGEKLQLGGRLGFDWPGTTMALAGIAMGFALSCTLVRRDSRWLAWIDGWSTSIYLLSWFPQIFFKIVLFQYLQLWWPAALAMFVGGLVLPVLVARWVRDHVPRVKLLVGL
jgi:peptidoglycan/LPS O-acetylase OafA/YrhL